MILPEVSRWDNESLANAAQAIAGALTSANNALGGKSETFSKWSLKLISRFAGDPITDETISTILTEAKANPNPLPFFDPTDPFHKNQPKPNKQEPDPKNEEKK